jgi:hypothetical protein
MTFTISVDVEHIKNVATGIDLYLGNENTGANGILNFLRKNHYTAIFFLDIGQSLDNLKPGTFTNTIEKIQENKHAIGMHIHPLQIDDRWPQNVGFSSESGFLTDYSRNGQKEILRIGSELLRNYLGYETPYFRSGSYAINLETLELLNELNFTHDFSIFWQYSKLLNDIEDFGNLGKYSVNSMTVIPVTSFVAKIPFSSKEIRKKIDPNWISLKEFKKFLDVFPRASNFEFFLHSFSFTNLNTGKLNTFALEHFKKMIELALAYGHKNIDVKDIKPEKFSESAINISLTDYSFSEIQNLILPKLNPRKRSVKKVFL